MKKLGLLAIVTLIYMAGSANAQWKFVKCFPDTNYKGDGHGIAVSPDGKVWTQRYDAFDSIKVGSSYKHVRGIHVYNADGSEASFSPITIYSGPGIQDTNYNSARGLKTDLYNGNILASSYNTVYELDYKTGAAVHKYTPPDSSTLTACPTDTMGDVFLGKVSPGNPMQIIDNTFSFVGNWTDTSLGYSRTLEVSKDGSTVYWCGYSNNAVYVYYSANGTFGPYTIIDTVAKGIQSESSGWQPGTGYLWLSTSYAVNGYPGANTSYSIDTWYAFDTKTWTVKDSIKWNWTQGYPYSSTDQLNGHPRGIAFSPTGDTAYVTMFNISGPAFQMFVKTATPVNEKPDNVPSSYSLSQNYPNPFNPSTRIDYALKETGKVSIIVYDVLGREVTTLVDGVQSAGQHSVTFNANNLPSGVYIYSLTTPDGSRLVKKMILMK